MCKIAITCCAIFLNIYPTDFKCIFLSTYKKQSAYSQMHASAAFILSADAPCGIHMANIYIKEADSGQQHSCIATFKGGTSSSGVLLLKKV